MILIPFSEISYAGHLWKSAMMQWGGDELISAILFRRLVLDPELHAMHGSTKSRGNHHLIMHALTLKQCKKLVQDHPG